MVKEVPLQMVPLLTVTVGEGFTVTEAVTVFMA
jgi:hypothetical protein